MTVEIRTRDIARAGALDAQRDLRVHLLRVESWQGGRAGPSARQAACVSEHKWSPIFSLP
ncbi:MAG: hypothetical protein C0518_02930 [Opitutus sp.]|nr:hypothetical protein [Opitutus sp.]